MLTYQKMPESLFKQLYGHLLGVICFSIIFSLLVFINFLQMISLVIYPVSPHLFRQMQRGFAFFWWGLVVLWFEKIYGLKIIFSGDAIPQKENAILIANHQGIADIPVVMSFGLRKLRLGDLKWFVKDIVKYIPGPGWGMLFLGTLYVKRNWFADKNKIYNTFHRFIKFKIPVWVISFSEGTRITPEKLKKSQKFAAVKGLKTPEHVLIPKTKGFSAALLALESHIDAVYDLTIGYPQGIPLAWQLVQGFVKEVYVHVKRYEVKDLPKNESEISDWLMSRFYEKDERLKKMTSQNEFSGENFKTHPTHKEGVLTTKGIKKGSVAEI